MAEYTQLLLELGVKTVDDLRMVELKDLAGRLDDTTAAQLCAALRSGTWVSAPRTVNPVSAGGGTRAAPAGSAILAAITRREQTLRRDTEVLTGLGRMEKRFRDMEQNIVGSRSAVRQVRIRVAALDERVAQQSAILEELCNRSGDHPGGGPATETLGQLQWGIAAITEQMAGQSALLGQLRKNSPPPKANAEPAPEQQPAFHKLYTAPPCQRLELSDTNKYSWPGATEAQETALYKATWSLLQRRGLGAGLCEVLRTVVDERLTLFLSGNVPLNYYLLHTFKAPAAIPSNDIDVKVDIGEHMRALLTDKGGPPAHDYGKNVPREPTEWTAEEKARVDGCCEEALALFVEYATRLMGALKARCSEFATAIEKEMAPHGIGFGPKGVHVYHKTHAAAPKNKDGTMGEPLHLVPLSGGVFQLMVELTAPTPAKDVFIWNVVDLECDWKTGKNPHGTCFPTETVPMELRSVMGRGLRLLSCDEVRKDLDNKYQVAKEERRRLKREYYDWAKAAYEAQHHARRSEAK